MSSAIINWRVDAAGTEHQRAIALLTATTRVKHRWIFIDYGVISQTDQLRHECKISMPISLTLMRLRSR
jgi:hypothetical protein